MLKHRESKIMTDIETRPIEIRDCTAAQKLLNQTFGAQPYSRPMDAYEVQEQLMGRGLATYYPMQWQQQVCWGARFLTAKISIITASTCFPTGLWGFSVI